MGITSSPTDQKLETQSQEFLPCFTSYIFFVIEIYIYIYIYIYTCHPQTDLLRSIRTHQYG